MKAAKQGTKKRTQKIQQKVTEKEPKIWPKWTKKDRMAKKNNVNLSVLFHWDCGVSEVKHKYWNVVFLEKKR